MIRCLGGPTSPPWGTQSLFPVFGTSIWHPRKYGDLKPQPRRNFSDFGGTNEPIWSYFGHLMLILATLTKPAYTCTDCISRRLCSIVFRRRTGPQHGSALQLPIW